MRTERRRQIEKKFYNRNNRTQGQVGEVGSGGKGTAKTISEFPCLTSKCMDSDADS